MDRGPPDGGVNPYTQGGVLDAYPFVRPGGWTMRERGDVNCDGVINAPDIEPFLVALFDPEDYSMRFPDCSIDLADINEDGSVDGLDIEPFLALLFP